MSKRRPSSLTISPERESRGLSEQQLIFVERVASGLNPTAAARAAGYADPEGAAKDNKADALITLEIERQRGLLQKEVLITRKDAIEGFMRAIEDGKLMADPMAQIAGWREIVKMLGYYAPEVKKIELSQPAARVKQKFESLSDEKLLEMMQGDIIDVEFTRAQ